MVCRWITAAIGILALIARGVPAVITSERGVHLSPPRRGACGAAWEGSQFRLAPGNPHVAIS